MPRQTKGKGPKTVVKTGVTTGTAVALLFLSASAAFAAAAFTKMPKTSFMKTVEGADLTFVEGKQGVANFQDATTIQLQAVYTNAGNLDAAKHESAYYFADKNQMPLEPSGEVNWDVGVTTQPGGIHEVDKRIENVPKEAVYVVLSVDNHDNAPETNETNNKMFIALNRPASTPTPVTIVPPRITLSPQSPNGAAVPGLNEVLRFTIAADASSDVVFDAITFKVSSTDNARTQWNVNDDASGVIDTTAAWSLYDTSDMTTQREDGDADWTLYGAGVSDAVLSGSEIVGFARLSLSQPIIIAAGSTKTFALKVDTTGASSFADDYARFDIVAENTSTNTTLAALHEFKWDHVASRTNDLDGTNVRWLPITGGSIIY